MQLLKITYNKCLYLVKPTPPDVLWIC
jgi:hypothetical protein